MLHSNVYLTFKNLSLSSGKSSSNSIKDSLLMEKILQDSTTRAVQFLGYPEKN
jgi:hypothetical protein